MGAAVARWAGVGRDGTADCAPHEAAVLAGQPGGGSSPASARAYQDPVPRITAISRSVAAVAQEAGTTRQALYRRDKASLAADGEVIWPRGGKAHVQPTKSAAPAASEDAPPFPVT